MQGDQDQGDVVQGDGESSAADEPKRSTSGEVQSRVEEPKVQVDPALQRAGTGGASNATTAQMPRRGSAEQRGKGGGEEKDKGDGGGKARGRSIWGWIVVLVLLAASAGLVSLDLYHRNRYRIVCRKGRVELQRGRRLPVPIGFEALGGVFGPMALPNEGLCVERSFHRRHDGEAAYLKLLMTQARRALANPMVGRLKQTRQQLLRALEITRSSAHRLHQQAARDLLADLSYREGRAILARVEADLRLALARLRRTRSLAGDRYEDLAQWIAHLDALLRGITPAPATLQQPGMLGPRGPLIDSAPPRIRAPRGGPSPAAPSDAGVQPARDAEPGAQSGVLM